MTNKDLINLYNLNKIGIHNSLKKICLCGEEMDINEKVCPKCGTALPKSSLLNVYKNSALAKRFETTNADGIYSFKIYSLLSNGFELYESETLNFSINTKDISVKISDSKIFKALGRNEEFLNSLNTNFGGFYSYVEHCLSQFEFEYAVSNFTSLNESQITNFLNVYINYKALIPYLRGYKVFYYGSKVNLKKYFPDVDFNDTKAVEELGLSLKLLLMWDIKNEKYIETIIDLSHNSTTEELSVLSDIIEMMLNATKDRYNRELTYNDIIDAFSLLFNREISLQNFIRIYNNSHENFFAQIYKFRQAYKKCVNRTIDWNEIEKLDRKTVGTMESRCDIMREFKKTKDQVNEIYEVLEKDPIAALKMLE
jgi:hypothetical protein